MSTTKKTFIEYLAESKSINTKFNLRDKVLEYSKEIVSAIVAKADSESLSSLSKEFKVTEKDIAHVALSESFFYSMANKILKSKKLLDLHYGDEDLKILESLGDFDIHLIAEEVVFKNEFPKALKQNISSILKPVKIDLKTQIRYDDIEFKLILDGKDIYKKEDFEDQLLGKIYDILKSFEDLKTYADSALMYSRDKFINSLLSDDNRYCEAKFTGDKLTFTCKYDD